MSRDYPIPNDIPVDAIAARTMRKGVHFEPVIKSTHTVLEWDAPPEMLPIPPTIENCIGEKQGQMTIIGWYGQGKWVARCQCGLYESRRNNNWVKWRNNPNPKKQNRCRRCQKIDHIRWMGSNRDKINQIHAQYNQPTEPESLSAQTGTLLLQS